MLPIYLSLLSCHPFSDSRKLLANDQPNVEDLEGVDYSIAHSLVLMRNIASDPHFDAAMFSATFFQTFTTNSSDDRIVELIPNGANIDVTLDTCQKYCDLVLQYRLHEFDAQAAAIRAGMATIVPIAFLVSTRVFILMLLMAVISLLAPSALSEVVESINR